MFGAIFVQAAIRGGLEICAVQMRMTESLYIYIQTALHCTVNRKKISRNIIAKLEQSATLMACISSSGSVIKNSFDQTLE